MEPTNDMLVRDGMEFWTKLGNVIDEAEGAKWCDSFTLGELERAKRVVELRITILNDGNVPEMINP